MKMKTSELTGPALDWAVAKCESEAIRVDGVTVRPALGQFMPENDWYRPSTDWTQGGPIIEREGVTLQAGGWKDTVWRACLDGLHPYGERQYGETALVAAMRCYVASKLGDIVEVPEGL